MILYFIRHGQPEYSKDESGKLLVYGPDAPLSREGKDRVAAIAGSILRKEGRPFDGLVSSPYERAIQTARIMAEAMGMDPAQIAQDIRLRDTDSTWPGRRVDEFLKVWEERRVFDDPDVMETLADLRERMTAAVNDHVSRFQGEMIGFVGHGDPLRAWVYPYEKPFPSYRDFVAATFEAAEGVRVVMDGKRPSVELIGEFHAESTLRIASNAGQGL